MADETEPLPTGLLYGVNWTFRGAEFPDLASFVAAVSEANDPESAKEFGLVWLPDEVVLRVPRVCVCVDDGWYPSDEDFSEAEFEADDGAAFTAGELLFKTHNAFVGMLRQMDHKYFEGMTLVQAGFSDPERRIPRYDLDLGS